jgi:hypothetical protein
VFSSINQRLNNNGLFLPLCQDLADSLLLFPSVKVEDGSAGEQQHPRARKRKLEKDTKVCRRDRKLLFCDRRCDFLNSFAKKSAEKMEFMTPNAAKLCQITH